MEERKIPETNSEQRGIVELTWDKYDPTEVASAENKFVEYTRKGWLAFSVSKDNEKRQVFRFNVEFEKILLMPIVEGG